MKWAEKVAKAQTGIVRQSAQDLAHEANKPQARGGRMPVDTGFLRGSIAASTDGVPASGGLPVELVIIQWEPGQSPIWIGWTANYARYMEARYAFMRLGAQNWPMIVKRNVITAAIR